LKLKPRVLFIDDDPAFLKIVSERVRHEGYESLTETNADRAIKLIREGGVDVAFVDFKMPVKNGVEVIEAIRQFNPTIPLVLLTGFADSAIMEKYKTLNIHGFFSKLDDFKKLTEILKVILRGFERSRSKS